LADSGILSVFNH
jgi:hypothetical protein